MKDDKKIGFVEMMPLLEVCHDGRVGMLDDMIHSAMQEAIYRTMVTGKKSKLTVTLDFERESDRRFETKATLKTALLDFEIKNSRAFYRDAKGNITLEDGNQGKMFDSDGEVAAPLKRTTAA